MLMITILNMQNPVAQILPTKTDSVKTPDSLLQKKDSVAQSHFGRISVKTSPDSAEITLDSIEKGLSPLILDSVSGGVHILLVKKKGCFGKRVTVDVAPDSTAEINVALVKPSGLVVSSFPSVAQVFLDGKPVGSSPWENIKLKPGDHVVKVERDSFFTVEKKITLLDGKTDSLTVTLDRAVFAPAAVMPVKKSFFNLNKDMTLIASGVLALFVVVILSIELSGTGK